MSRASASRGSSASTRRAAAAVLTPPLGHGHQRGLCAGKIVGFDAAVDVAQRQPQRLVVERRALGGIEAATRVEVVQPAAQRGVAIRRGQQFAIAQAHAHGRVLRMRVEPVAHQRESRFDIVGLSQCDPFAADRGQHLRIVAGGIGGAPQRLARVAGVVRRDREPRLPHQPLRVQVRDQFPHAGGVLGDGNGIHLRAGAVDVVHGVHEQRGGIAHLRAGLDAQAIFHRGAAQRGQAQVAVEPRERIARPWRVGREPQ
nr:hypothetical protein [Cupriavidus gilardii]